MAQAEEKERKKMLALEEKERRKVEREEKRRQKEMEQKRKAEEWLKKMEMRAKKVSEANKQCSRRVREKIALRDKESSNSKSKTSCSEPPTKTPCKEKHNAVLTLKLTLMCAACVQKMSQVLTGLSVPVGDGCMLLSPISDIIDS